jgi:sigma-B regulation protein RsbU (phosphoserine phosphatase)
VFLVDPVEGDIVCRACAGPVDVVGLRVQQGRGIVGRAIAENRVQMVRDTSRDPDYIGDQRGFHTRSILCAPLDTAEGAIGALQVLNKRDGALFDSHDANVLRLLAVPTALALNNSRLTRELVEQNRIKREFQLARQMQKTLLPARRRDYPVTALNLPAREISGDFYDYFELADGRIAFCVGDVSGKGMDAALLMVRASSCLRWVGKDGTPPGAWLAKVNRELCETVTRGMFVCAVAGYYDPRTSMVEIANAGFPPLLLRRADESMRELQADGPPLGILDQISYASQRLALAGGCLYAFSDGVTDVRDGERRPIGVEGVRALIDRVSGLSPRARVTARRRAISAASPPAAIRRTCAWSGARYPNSCSTSASTKTSDSVSCSPWTKPRPTSSATPMADAATAASNCRRGWIPTSSASNCATMHNRSIRNGSARATCPNAVPAASASI